MKPRTSLRAGRIAAASLATASALATALAVGAVTATARTAASPPENAVPPAVSGTAREGETLAASTGSWSGTTPFTYAYRWNRCNSAGAGCNGISGATGTTYTLASADVGATIRVSVTATNSAGSATTLSSATGVVASRGSAPAATKQPNPSGTPQEGQTVTVDNGTWSGTQPLSFAYQWQRCTAQGADCAGISGATKQSYTAVSADVGSKLRAVVTATNSIGSGTIASNLTAIVAPKGTPPASSTPPLVAGDTTVGQTLIASTGVWTGSSSFDYRWQRCDQSGANCSDISGATGQTYTLTSADAGSKIRAVVTAHNSYGSASASSAATAVVGTGQPSGVIVVAGLKSVSASSLSLPDRLVIDKVAFSPSVLTSHNQAVTARFHVASTNGYVVRDALVYVLGLPYGWVMNAPETPTGVDGWATLTLHPTTQVPIQPGRAIVMFVRARKDGDNLLAGISTRRLVQLRVS